MKTTIQITRDDHGITLLRDDEIVYLGTPGGKRGQLFEVLSKLSKECEEEISKNN